MFRGTCCPILHDVEIKKDVMPWRWRRHIPPKLCTYLPSCTLGHTVNFISRGETIPITHGIQSVVLVNQSHYRPEVPIGFQEVKVPRLRDNGPGC